MFSFSGVNFTGKWKWNTEAKEKTQAQRGDPRWECWVEFSSSALWNFICALMGATAEQSPVSRGQSARWSPSSNQRRSSEQALLFWYWSPALSFFPLWLNATLLLKGTGSDLGDLWLPHHVTFSSLAELSSLKLPTRTKPMERKKAEIHVHETV